ncbi:MAG: tetratricopeptide repeat protein [Longimicrobiales bacterium]
MSARSFFAQRRAPTSHIAWLLALVVACGDAETAIARGDQYWADADYVNALAEYRLALRNDRSEATLSRVAHAYAETGQYERAKEMYDELIEQSPEYADQAVFDYVSLAGNALERADRYGMASAVEAAQELRPGLHFDEFAIPLARYYASTNDPVRALDFYERALTTAPGDTVPALLFEIAEMHESQGNCNEAIGFFRAFRARERRGDRAVEANWHIGNCSFNLARRARQIGDIDRALDYIDTVLDLRVPQNLVDEAWFERGELYLEIGRRDEALFAYNMVLELSSTGSGQLVDRARRRIDELRFGRSVS